MQQSDLYYKNRRLYLESRYKDGSGSTDEMTEQLYDFGKKLLEESGNPHGEYFVLDSKGDLHSGGKGGLFLKYKKLQRFGTLVLTSVFSGAR